MKKKTLNQAVADFRDLIMQVRGVPVILDSDLARVYGVTTGALNQAVKRNRDRFPDEFVFLVDPQVTILKSQFVISSCPSMRAQSVTASGERMLSQIVTASAAKRNIRRPPSAFTEHGALMASMGS